MNQCGPDWHMLQFQRMRDVSDFMIWKECVHWAGFAICLILVVLVFWSLGGGVCAGGLVEMGRGERR